jgi:hypothetical protein
MNCNTCEGRGIIRLEWADTPVVEFAVCLCASGLAMRRATNEGRVVAPLWQVWCAREQVDPDLVFMVEDVLTGDELRERMLGVPAPMANREAALLARSRKR